MSNKFDCIIVYNKHIEICRGLGKHMSLIKMYSLTELHMDSWSGNEWGRKYYFRDEAEANQYRDSYNRNYNNKPYVPEYYKVFTVDKWEYVEENNLVLEHDSLGTYCLEKIL